jgi:hypothetical protein
MSSVRPGQGLAGLSRRLGLGLTRRRGIGKIGFRFPLTPQVIAFTADLNEKITRMKCAVAAVLDLLVRREILESLLLLAKVHS